MIEEKESKDDSQILQLLLFKIQSGQDALQSLTKQLVLVERSVAEIEDSMAAVEEIPKTKEEESLVPLGSGIFIKANLLEKSKFLVSIGAGIFLDKTTAETKTYLGKQKEELEKNQELLTMRIRKIQGELAKTSREAEELYAKLQNK